MIKLTEAIIDDIKRHAERDYPHECGGMLIGRFLFVSRMTRVDELEARRWNLLGETSSVRSRHHAIVTTPQHERGRLHESAVRHHAARVESGAQRREQSAAARLPEARLVTATGGRRLYVNR